MTSSCLVSKSFPYFQLHPPPLSAVVSVTVHLPVANRLLHYYNLLECVVVLLIRRDM